MKNIFEEKDGLHMVLDVSQLFNSFKKLSNILCLETLASLRWRLINLIMNNLIR